jgi:hypothetical protein
MRNFVSQICNVNLLSSQNRIKIHSFFIQKVKWPFMEKKLTRNSFCLTKISVLHVIKLTW